MQEYDRTSKWLIQHHGDSILRPPAGFHPTAQTDSTPFAGLVDPDPGPVEPTGDQVLLAVDARDPEAVDHVGRGQLEVDGAADPRNRDCGAYLPVKA